MTRKILFPGFIGLGLMIMTLAIVSSCKKKDDTTPPDTSVLGCMNSTALNFNALATKDDGSCLIPEVKHRSILLDFTATWCSPCGADGIPMFEAAIASNANEVVPMGCHNADEMSNPTSEDILTYYNPSGIPTLVAGTYFDVWGATMINNAIANTNAIAPIANATGIMTNSGSAITVKTQTKFFSATSGNYYLAIYFVENGLVYHQNSATPDPYTHKHVLRGVAKGSAFGDLIASGNITEGTLINKDFTYTAGAGWNMANVYIALVIWKSTGSNWTFVNAWQSKAN